MKSIAAPRSPKKASRKWRSCSAAAISTSRKTGPSLHHVQQALKAHVLFQRDKDYLVQDGAGDHRRRVHRPHHARPPLEGRAASGHRSQGNVKIERENQTLATITFQNYFRMYKKLAGMTGTAETEAAEFEKTYKLDVAVIPTNRAMLRKEFQDVVYRTEDEKFRNAAKEIKELYEKGQPVLVGTISVEKSETAVQPAEEDGRQARGLERQESRARSVHRRAGRTQRRHHGFHQHGRPRHRHFAGRQSRIPHQGISEEAEQGSGCAADQRRRDARARRMGRGLHPLQGGDRRGARRSGRASADCTCSAPSATNPAASTISSADAPAARATPAVRASISRCKTT